MMKQISTLAEGLLRATGIYSDAALERIENGLAANAGMPLLEGILKFGGEKEAVFLEKIGGVLKSGQKHDGRAPDYDDWELNGDIILYSDILERAFEISSMGIRVDEEAMDRQLRLSGDEDRRDMDFHKMILNKELPYTIGGGIGQSRLCMYFLRKAHIGEVQASIWPEDMIRTCAENDIFLL